MGTRAMTYIHNGNRHSDVICAVYRQMDGYPTCMGEEIKASLGDKKYVNGLTDDTDVVNGMGCAAAVLVRDLKDCPGSIYMISPGAGDEEYNYHIFSTATGCALLQMQKFPSPLSSLMAEKSGLD